MVNNSTNISKTNNHSWPQTSEDSKGTKTEWVGNPGPGLVQAKIVTRLNPLFGPQPSSGLYNWISNRITDIYCAIPFSSIRQNKKKNMNDFHAPDGKCVSSKLKWEKQNGQIIGTVGKSNKQMVETDARSIPLAHR